MYKKSPAITLLEIIIIITAILVISILPVSYLLYQRDLYLFQDFVIKLSTAVQTHKNRMLNNVLLSPENSSLIPRIYRIYLNTQDNSIVFFVDYVDINSNYVESQMFDILNLGSFDIIIQCNANLVFHVGYSKDFENNYIMYSTDQDILNPMQMQRFYYNNNLCRIIVTDNNINRTREVFI